MHWGGDNTSTFSSMAETLRGGLSLAASGFGYWSHDIGGFEGTPDPAVFMQFLPRIKQASNVVVNITTGGSLGMSIEDRLAAPLRASASATRRRR